jgi:hypothetical protein
VAAWLSEAIEKSPKDAERYAALCDIAVCIGAPWRNIQRHLRDTDTDWNRRRHATSNLGVQLVLAADPKEHQHSVDGNKKRTFGSGPPLTADLLALAVPPQAGCSAEGGREGGGGGSSVHTAQVQSRPPRRDRFDGPRVWRGVGGYVCPTMCAPSCCPIMYVCPIMCAPFDSLSGCPQ